MGVKAASGEQKAMITVNLGNAVTGWDVAREQMKK